MSLKSMEHSFYLNGSNTREHLLSWNYNTKNKTKKYFFKIFTLEKKSDEGEIKKKKKDEGKSNKKEITWGKSLQIYQLVPKIYCEKIADIRMRAP